MLNNGDGLLYLETYEPFDCPDTPEELEELYSWLELYTVFAEGDDNADYEHGTNCVSSILKNYDMDKLTKLDYNDTVIEFSRSNLQEMLFIANFENLIYD